MDDQPSLTPVKDALEAATWEQLVAIANSGIGEPQPPVHPE